MGLFNISNRKPEQLETSSPIKFRYLDPPAGYEKQEIQKKIVKKGTTIAKALKDLKKPAKKKKKTSR